MYNCYTQVVILNTACNFTQCMILHTVYTFTHSVYFYTPCITLHTVYNFTFNDNFELLGVTLRCFVARQLLSRIYALLSVKFPGLKLRLCKKMTNIRYGVGLLNDHHD